MRRHVLPNLGDFDREARELVTTAAHRAGLSVEDWAAALARNDDPMPEQYAPAARAPGKDYEALMAAAAAESERRLRERQERQQAMPRETEDRAARTAIALESMAGWIEQAEERLTETARASAAHRDRMATVLAQALTAVKDRLDTVERTAADHPTSPQIEGIRTEIGRLQSSMEGLATSGEIAALNQAIRALAREVAKELEQGHTSRDLLTLASAVAALHRQVQGLAGDTADGLHRRIGGEIDQIKAKIDRIAETGVDRSVIDFLSSQIVDLRHDLTLRAEPQQVVRLSEDVAALGLQIADLRASQIGRNDFTSLKSSLEDVCTALGRAVAVQEASEVPEQLQQLNRRLDGLASRPEPKPVDLDPIAEQLTRLTEHMAHLSDSRTEQADALAEMIGRLSAQVQAVSERDPPSHEPLFERFDRIEQELRQVGQQADTSGVELMLRSIEEKLDRAPVAPSALQALDERIAALSERIAGAPDEALHKALGEATARLKTLQDEAAEIAERAARAALKDLQASLPDAGDLDALKHGFFELKALQSRADKKTQDTLRAVQEALEALLARSSGAVTAPAVAIPAIPDDAPSPDRLEAAVRRLHAAALSQAQAASVLSWEEGLPSSPMEAQPADASTALLPSQDDGIGSVRATFIAAARRAAQTAEADRPFAEHPDTSFAPGPDDMIVDLSETDESGEPDLSPRSLLERLRQSLNSNRRPLLFGLALLILATGGMQILFDRQAGPAAAALAETVQAKPGRDAAAAAPEPEAASATGSTTPAAPQPNLFQPASMTTLAATPANAAPSSFTPPPPSAQGKFFVDPSTVGAIPPEVPVPLRKAAQAGDAAAIYEVASRAAEGRGLPKDMILAIRLFERAAQAGMPPAQERLATFYEKGIGVWRDLKMAVTWYERAAQGGHVRAMHNLATLLGTGVNGKPDYAAAFRWYAEAAEYGARDSQFNAGVLLLRGTGTRQDLSAAYKWFALAAAQGDTEATKRRDEIAARLAAPELAGAKATVEGWHARIADPAANEVRAWTAGEASATDGGAGERS